MAGLVLALILLVGLCSAAPNSGRIVGGEPTSVEHYPSIVQMEFFRNNAWGQACAGSILNEVFVVSAAHCTTMWFDPQYHVNNRRIRAGATNRNIGGSIHNAASILNHPTFFPLFRGLDADICLVRLQTPLTFNNGVRMAIIPPQNFETPDNVDVVHAGWGAIRTDGPASSVLLDVTVQTVNNEVCRQRYADPPNPAHRGTVTQNMICAGILDVGGKDACQGDSGGPLYYGDSLIGIVSWGGDCADSFLPGVSARVSSYTNWIVTNAQ